MEVEKLAANLSVVPHTGGPSPDALLSKKSAREEKPDLMAQLSQSRLVIERDAERGRWIYKAVDPSTGEVLSQIPISSILDFVRLRRNGVICDFRA